MYGWGDTKLPPGLDMLADKGQPYWLFATVEYLQCATTVCNSLHLDLQWSETNWCRRNSATRSLVVLPPSENQMWPCAFFPARRSHSRRRSSASILLVSSRTGCPGKSSRRKWLGSGKSRRRSRTCITTHSSSPTGRLCCSPSSVRVSTQLCCNCQLLRARRRTRRSRSALLSSPDLVGERERGRRNRSDCGAEAQTSSIR